MLRFVGFGHRRQMGKDTAANQLKILIQEMCPGLEVECRAFADPMYEICHKLYGWDGFETKAFYDANPEYKNVPLIHIGMTPRDLLINVGTLAFRDNVWKSTWVEYLMHIHPKNSECLVLITDVRFPNEFEVIKKNDGFCFQIVRPGIPLSNDVADSALDCYLFDKMIVNDGTPVDLGTQAYKALCKCIEPFHLLEWVYNS